MRDIPEHDRDPLLLFLADGLPVYIDHHERNFSLPQDLSQVSSVYSVARDDGVVPKVAGWDSVGVSLAFR